MFFPHFRMDFRIFFIFFSHFPTFSNNFQHFSSFSINFHNFPSFSTIFHLFPIIFHEIRQSCYHIFVILLLQSYETTISLSNNVISTKMHHLSLTISRSSPNSTISPFKLCEFPTKTPFNSSPPMIARSRRLNRNSVSRAASSQRPRSSPTRSSARASRSKTTPASR